MKIYDTDVRVLIGRVRDDYSESKDMESMLNIIGNTKSSEERNTAFIENLYKIDGISKYWKVDKSF